MTIRRRYYNPPTRRRRTKPTRTDTTALTYSPPVSYCERCGTLCRYPQDEYHNLCGYCARAAS